MVETYAFLDSDSNTSFCTDSLLEKLSSVGRKTTLSLTTLEGENIPSECYLVSLEVSDLNQENVVELPVVYSRPSLQCKKTCHKRYSQWSLKLARTVVHSLLEQS